MDLIVRKRKADMETKGMALIWATVLRTVTIIEWFPGRCLAVCHTTRRLKKKKSYGRILLSRRKARITLVKP